MGKRYLGIRYGLLQPHSKSLKYFTIFSVLWVLFFFFYTIGIIFSVDNTFVDNAVVVSTSVIFFFIFGYPIIVLQNFWQRRLMKKRGELLYEYRPYQLPDNYEDPITRYITYGRKQRFSKKLKYFSYFTHFWLGIWLGILFIIISDNYENTGEVSLMIAGWMLLAVIVCTPVVFIQVIGTKRVKLLATRIEELNSSSKEFTVNNSMHGQLNSGRSIAHKPVIDPSLHNMNGIEDHQITRDEKIVFAGNYVKALRYEEAARLYEECNLWEEAGKVRWMKFQMENSRSFFNIDHVENGTAFLFNNGHIRKRDDVGVDHFEPPNY